MVLNDVKATEYKLADTIAGQAFMGQALTVQIDRDVESVTIYYTTSPQAAALQWLGAEQTKDKNILFFSRNRRQFYVAPGFLLRMVREPDLLLMQLCRFQPE